MTADRWRYIKLLRKTVERTSWMCLSYCLMGNHVHLLIETREPNLGAGMHRLHGAYAQWFNRRHGFVGHVFQNRYESVTIENDPQLWVTAAYIARNPVTPASARRRTTGSGAATPRSSRTAPRRGSTAIAWRPTSRARRRRHHPLHGASSTRSANLNGDSPSLGGVYGPEDSERRSGRRNQKVARRAAMAAGAA